jgi:glutathione S-transferase
MSKFQVDNKSLAIGALAGAALTLGVAKLCSKKCCHSNKNSKFTLTYFDIYGLAEVSRLLLTAADQKFTDDRFDFQVKEDGSFFTGKWPEVKSSGRFPFKTLPLLEVDGLALNQSRAIESYLADRFNFRGNNAGEAAAVDGVAEQIKDIRTSFGKVAQDEAKRTEWFLNELPKQLATLEEFATKNGKQDHFFVGNQLSLADIAFFNLWASVFEKYQGEFEKVLASTKRLSAIKNAVGKNERIAAYLAKRPKRMF